MKKLLALAAVLIAAAPAVAQEQQTYRPFTYETPCILEAGDQTYPDVCKVVETREKSGALRTRNIFSKKFGFTIKGRFGKKKS